MIEAAHLSEPPPLSRSDIRVSRPFHAWLHYHVLSHLDLGGDLSSVYDPTTPDRAWAKPLLHALGAPRDRLAAQFLPLWADDHAALVERRDGRLLTERLRAAWTAEHGRVAARWHADRGYARRLDGFWGAVAEPLEACRALLDAPLPLHVVDVPALGAHARMSVADGQRVVALSLDAPADEVLCQLVYAEAHGEVEGEVFAEGGRRARDTRRGSAGWTLHAALDGAVLDRCRGLLDAAWPAALPGFEAWSRRLGVAPSLGCLGLGADWS